MLRVRRALLVGLVLLPATCWGNLLLAAEVTAMDEEIKKIVQASIDFAEASPELPVEALMEDILVETTS